MFIMVKSKRFPFIRCTYIPNRASIDLFPLILCVHSKNRGEVEKGPPKRSSRYVVFSSEFSHLDPAGNRTTYYSDPRRNDKAVGYMIHYYRGTQMKPILFATSSAS